MAADLTLDPLAESGPEGWDPQARTDPRFLALPKSFIRACIDARFPPAHRAVLVELAAEANYRPTRVAVNGVVVTLDVGETLLSGRSFAERHRLGPGEKGRSLLRRALGAGVRAGLLSLRPAVSSAGPATDPPRSHRGDPPPTIVRFLRYREIMWPSKEADPPADPAQPPDPTPSNTHTPNNRGTGQPMRPALAPLPSEVTTVKAAIEALIGRDLVVPMSPTERDFMVGEFQHRLRIHGHDTVVAMCALAATTSPQVFSMGWFARSWERVERGYGVDAPIPCGLPLTRPSRRHR